MSVFTKPVLIALSFTPSAPPAFTTRACPWNGITGITESPSGAEPNNLYADNIKYLVLVGAEDFGLTVECYTYPDEWEECDGSAEIAPGVVAGQQNRKVSGLSYRTKLGNDVDGQDPPATSCTWSTAAWPLPLSGAIRLSTTPPSPSTPAGRSPPLPWTFPATSPLPA